MDLQQLPDPDLAALPDPDAHSETKIDPGQIFRQNPFEDSKTAPSIPKFLKNVEMIGSGAAQGSLEFTGGLLSYAEKALRGGGKPTVVPGAYEYWAEKNKKDAEENNSSLPALGRFAGEMLTTAPLSAPLGLAAKGAQAVGELLPVGLKTLGKYGASGLSGAGILAGLESQRFDPENPAQLINTEAASAALKDPLSYALPMAGTKLSTWAEASRKLGEAKELYPNIMARDLKEPGITKKISNMVFDALPTITGIGKRVSQIEGAGEDISNFVAKLAGTPEALSSKDLIGYAGKQLNGALNVLKLKGNLLWEKPFKDKIVPNIQDVKDDVINAIDMLKGSSVPASADTIKLLQTGLRKQKMTVDDVKQLQTVIGKSSINARHADKAGVLNDIADGLQDVKDSLLNKIQDSLSSNDMKDFSAAREYSAKQFELMKSSPKIQKALKTEIDARKLIRDLLSEKEVTDKQTVLNVLPSNGKKAVAAAKIAGIMESADNNGKLNLDTFLKKTKENTQVPDILGTESYKALEGLNKYLSSVNDASQLGQKQSAAVLAGIGATGAYLGGTPLLTYGAAQFAANHSPLKTLLHAATKNLPKSTYDAVTKNIEKHLTRAGYLIAEDGTLKHKDED